MNSSIIEKIRKLRALATSSNANEAAAAAAAADRLIQEHRIAEAELHADAPEAPTRGEALYTSTRITRWRSQLAGTLLAHYGCWGIHDRTRVYGQIVLSVYGTPSDIEIVRYMYAWLSAEAVRLCKVKGRTERNSWFVGFVAGIHAQLKTSAVTPSAGRSAGLVHLASARQRSEALGRQEHPDSRKTPHSQARVDPTAYDAGKNTGANVHLGKGLDVRPTRLLK